MFGHTVAAPLGVAAGPHTQLAQNIVASWLCGARFIELKTVQILDEIEVSRPCIDAAGRDLQLRMVPGAQAGGVVPGVPQRLGAAARPGPQDGPRRTPAPTST